MLASRAHIGDRKRAMQSDSSSPSRRDVLKGAAAFAAAATPLASSALTSMSADPFLNLHRSPDVVRAFGPNHAEIALNSAPGRWEAEGVRIQYSADTKGSVVRLESKGKVSLIQLRWKGDLHAIKRVLGDHWERSYGDLEWRGQVAGRTMPWYFLAHDGTATHSYGVAIGPKAFCFWNMDAEGISLWLDVRSGGAPVELGDRVLEVAKVVTRPGRGGESPFQAATAFCHLMSPSPRLPSKPVYGTNDWNYAYGNNSRDLIEKVSGLVSELSPSNDNRPYSVIDEGWAMGPYNNSFGHGPWEGNPRFGDMGTVATSLKKIGVRPGIWFRPLTPLPDTPESWRLSRDKSYLDPTIPDVLEHVKTHIRRFADWGYEMVKHDFSTWDVTGRWGFEMGPSPTHDGWHLHDRSKTTAEALTGLYQALRDAAGTVSLIGCNTVGHLAAGFHELQRTGDDTSGRSWNRNRRMGVNTLAFRAAQHRSFFEVDPDIVSITQQIPWYLVEQWLRLVSESGAALFVAMDPSIVEEKHRIALKKALTIAATTQKIGEPLDWLETDCPRRWKLRDKTVEFEWMGQNGAWPFGD